MVYCGKPSKACLECRAKRTRVRIRPGVIANRECDQLRPSCTQCVRTGRRCSGYRDPTTLAFRDQTSEVTSKQNYKNAVARKVPTAVPGFKHSSGVTTFVLPPNPSFIIDDYAVSFFFTNWVTKNPSMSRGQFDCLPLLYKSKSISPALSNTIMALGMAGLSHAQQDPRLLYQARSRYNVSLRAINLVLRDLQQTKEDQTLLAILLMGMYESYTCSTPSALEAWTKHIDGAIEVLRVRGIEQLQTPIGIQLFYSLRSQVITHCLHSHRRVPPYLVKWTALTLPNATETEAHNTRLVNIILRFCSLWADCSDVRFFSDPPLRLVKQAFDIDVELQQWAAQATAEHKFDVIKVAGDERAFRGAYHSYQSLSAAMSLNGYRSARIILTRIILGGLLKMAREETDITDVLGVPVDNKTQLQYSKAVLQQLMTDVCRSVPYMLSWRLDNTPRPAMPKAGTGALVLWPLYSVSIMRVPRLDVAEWRDWAIRTFREINREIGNQQAHSMAHVLSIEKELSDADWCQDADDDLEHRLAVRQGAYANISSCLDEGMCDASSMDEVRGNAVPALGVFDASTFDGGDVDASILSGGLYDTQF